MVRLFLGGDLAVLQAPMFDGLSLDPLPSFDDGAVPADVPARCCHGLSDLQRSTSNPPAPPALADCIRKHGNPMPANGLFVDRPQWQLRGGKRSYVPVR